MRLGEIGGDVAVIDASAARANEPKLYQRPLVAAGAILAVALTLGYLTRPGGQGTATALRSSLRTAPDGVAALAMAIERLGRYAEPRTTPFVEADPVRGTVVLLQPPVRPTPREIHALLNRVRTGGTLVYAPPEMEARRRSPITVHTALMDSLGISSRAYTPLEMIAGQTLQEPRWHAHPLTEGMPAPLEPAFGIRLKDESDTVTTAVQPLLTARDEDGAVWMAAAELRLGHGRVVAFAHAAPLSNGAALDDPLAILATRAALAYTADSDTVFFAEYHQGIRGHRTQAEVLAQFFVGSPGGRVLLHLVALSFVAIACAGLRFGSPAPAVAPPDLERRSPLEHVSALADLYRKAGATETAALLLVARLARVARHPPPRTIAQADTLLRQLDVGGGPDAALARVRVALRTHPMDLQAIAAGIDEHLART